VLLLNNVFEILEVSCRDKPGVDLLVCKPMGCGSRDAMIGSDSPSNKAALVSCSREESRVCRVSSGRSAGRL
jgi:hypothetical protein